MSLNVRNLAARLFQRFTKKSTLKAPTPNRARLSVTTLEDRTVPTPVASIEVFAENANAVEGVANGLYRITRTDTAGPLPIYFNVGGTATEGSDFTAFLWEVTFLDGLATVDLAVVPIDDSISEPTKTMTITLPMFSPNNYYIGESDEATVAIADNDAPVVTVEASPDAVFEGDTGAIRLIRFGDLIAPLTVNYSVSGTATPESDFVPLGTTVTFAADEADAFVGVETLTDRSHDANETIVITVQTGTGYQPDPVDSATITLKETAGVTVEKIADAVEGGTGGMFRFTRTGDISAALTATYAVTGTATSAELLL